LGDDNKKQRIEFERSRWDKRIENREKRKQSREERASKIVGVLWMWMSNKGRDFGPSASLQIP
jgi:hypothetical protein